MANTSLNCPVDRVTVNEYQVRITAAFVCLLSIAFLFTGSWTIPAFLVVDFLVRAFLNGRYSSLHLLSGFIVQYAKLGNSPVDRGPKRFAAQVGFLFNAIVLLAVLAGWTFPAQIVSGLVVLFAFLESALGFCAGCYIYTAYQKLFGIAA